MQLHYILTPDDAYVQSTELFEPETQYQQDSETNKVK